MKKYLYRLLILFAFIPFIANAASSWVSVTGDSYVEINDEVTVNFKYVMEELTKSSLSNGMYSLTFEIEFDDTVLTPVAISTPSNWDAEIVTTTDKKYYVISAVGEKTSANRCTDGILLCGPIEFDITFVLNETEKETVDIKTGEYLAAFMPFVDDRIEDMTEDDIVVKTGTIEEVHTITVKPSTHEKKNVQSIVENSNSSSNSIKNDVQKSTSTNNSEEKQQKYNNNLGKLEIEGYEINFDKYKKIYTIEVPEEVNSLNIYASTEDSSASYTVKGADNLQENNNKVIIDVTAADGGIKTYVINVTKEEPLNIETKAQFSLDKQGIEIAKYFLIGVSIIGVLSFIVIKIKDRKVEKEIDKL